jgi:hypothetical protein
VDPRSSGDADYLGFVKNFENKKLKGNLFFFQFSLKIKSFTRPLRKAAVWSRYVMERLKENK